MFVEVLPGGTGGVVHIEGLSVSNNYIDVAGCDDSAYNSKAKDQSDHQCGGGGLVVDQKGVEGKVVHLRNTLVQQNSAPWNGGGIHARHSDLYLDQTTVERNVASKHGGGIYGLGTTVSLNDARVVSNYALHGAGVHMRGGNAAKPSLLVGSKDSTLMLNNATECGGNVMADVLHCDREVTDVLCTRHLGCLWSKSKEKCSLDRDASSTTFEKVVLLDGIANDGGGACFKFAKVTLADCEIVANRARKSGGGMTLQEGSTVLAVRGLIVSLNVAEEDGGGISMRTRTSFNSTSLLRKAYVDRNVAWHRGGGVFMDDADVRVVVFSFLLFFSLLSLLGSPFVADSAYSHSHSHSHSHSLSLFRC